MFLFYLTFDLIAKRMSRKIEEAICSKEVKHSTIKSIEKMLIKKEKHKGRLEKTEIKLKKLGNPLKLTPIRYYAIKYGFPIILVIVGTLTGGNKFVIFYTSIFAMFLLDWVHRYNYKKVKKQIRRDLPDIYEILDIQTSAGAHIGHALTEIYDVPKCKRFRDDLQELAAEINLTKNIERAVDNFMDKYDYNEIDSFGLAIKQSLKTGKTKEMLENQGEYLKNNNILSIQEETKQISKRVGLIVLMLLAGGLLLLFYAFFTQASDSTTYIFK